MANVAKQHFSVPAMSVMMAGYGTSVKPINLGYDMRIDALKVKQVPVAHLSVALRHLVNTVLLILFFLVICKMLINIKAHGYPAPQIQYVC